MQGQREASPSMQTLTWSWVWNKEWECGTALGDLLLHNPSKPPGSPSGPQPVSGRHGSGLGVPLSLQDTVL